MKWIKRKRWLLLLPVVLVLVAGYFTFRFLNPRIVIFSDLWTYTMADDQTVYSIKVPGIYLEEVLPVANLNFFPQSILDQVSEFNFMVSVRRSEWYKRYAGHVQLDYSLKVEDGQIVITYTGTGKLRDGTIETISATDKCPAFAFEDQMAGLWEYPGYPWEDPSVKGPLYRDPNQVIEREWPEV